MTCLRGGYLRMRKRLFCREVAYKIEKEGFRVVMKESCGSDVGWNAECDNFEEKK
jgi:hypothetical protein